MDILQDAVMKDESLFNINPHYTECRVIHHPYARLENSRPCVTLKFNTKCFIL